MKTLLFQTSILSVAAAWLLAAEVPAAVSAEASWPELPAGNATAEIPAQAWPFQSKARTVKVYIYYPTGKLTDVNDKTGLMLSLHNWGGTGSAGTADPNQLASRYNVVAICVDYLQSGKSSITLEEGPYDFGYFQALDALRAIYFVSRGLAEKKIPFARGRMYAAGGSGGGNVTLMANKLAPRSFACVVDLSGMPKLTDDIAFNLPGGSELNAGYRRDPASPRYLSKDAQQLRFIGQPDHLATMKALGSRSKIIVMHGTGDTTCPFADAQEMVRNMIVAGLDVDPHFITQKDLDGRTFTDVGHGVGNRTRIVLHVADQYLLPESPTHRVRSGPSDFDLRDEQVRYATDNGSYVISYSAGFPVGRFEPKGQ